MVAHHESRLDHDAQLADRFPQLDRPLPEPGSESAVIQQTAEEREFLTGGVSFRDPDLSPRAERMIRGGNATLPAGEKKFADLSDFPSEAVLAFSRCNLVVVVERRREDFENVPVPL